MSVLEFIVLDAEQNPVMKCAESKFFICYEELDSVMFVTSYDDIGVYLLSVFKYWK